MTTLCAPRDQATLQQLLRELTTAGQPQRCRAVVRFGDRAIPTQLISLVEGGHCTGVLLILESTGTADAGASGAQDRTAAPAEGPTIGAGPAHPGFIPPGREETHRGKTTGG